MRASEFIYENKKSYQPPEIEVGDTVLVGKFKNRKAEVKGFETDEHNQPVLKTNKGDQKLFKPRIAKLQEKTDLGRTGSIEQDVALALPGAFKIPKLQNNDPYMQYRFGVAIAGAKGAKQRALDGVPQFSPESIFGENEIVVSYDPDVGEYIGDALKSMGMSPNDKVRIASPTSEEMPDVETHSPVIGFKGYPR